MVEEGRGRALGSDWWSSLQLEHPRWGIVESCASQRSRGTFSLAKEYADGYVMIFAMREERRWCARGQ